MDDRPDDPRDADRDDPDLGANDVVGAERDLDTTDEAILQALARAASTLDPVPTGLVERATFAVALDELEVEVAAIRASADADANALAGVRSVEGQALTMTFTAESLSLTLAVTETDRGRHRLDGWVTTDDRAQVTLRLGADAERTADVADGRFAFDDVPSGMVQVVVARGTDGGPVVVTPAFEL